MSNVFKVHSLFRTRPRVNKGRFTLVRESLNFALASTMSSVNSAVPPARRGQRKWGGKADSCSFTDRTMDCSVRIRC